MVLPPVNVQVLPLNVNVQVMAVDLPLAADVALIVLDVVVHSGHMIVEARSQKHFPA